MISINGRVWCAKCSKPVNKMEYTQDPFSGRFLFTVYCHGEKEQTILSREEIASAVSIDCTVAFKDGK